VKFTNSLPLVSNESVDAHQVRSSIRRLSLSRCSGAQNLPCTRKATSLRPQSGARRPLPNPRSPYTLRRAPPISSHETGDRCPLP
jgi:hypothetical protein